MVYDFDPRTPSQKSDMTRQIGYGGVLTAA
jgi:hypothetical protein